MPPLISIITATFDRSNVLALTIKSVQASTFRDWELWVIGDACTDDTEQVVLSFNDPRIHFVNLEQNIGEQSGPNNIGFQYCRGQYIAYLNHDDLWLPNHLETTLNGIQETGADLVFTLMDLVTPQGRNILGCATPTGRYDPSSATVVPASSWLLRRELVEEIGPWRFYKECYNMPSQEWLYRAWRAGKDMRLIKRMTIIAIQSGFRDKVYEKRESHENQYYYNCIISNPNFLEQELTTIAWDYASRVKNPSIDSLLLEASQLIKKTIKTILTLLGIHPTALGFFFTYRRKGGFVDHLRQKRGLIPLKHD